VILIPPVLTVSDKDRRIDAGEIQLLAMDGRQCVDGARGGLGSGSERDRAGWLSLCHHRPAPGRAVLEACPRRHSLPRPARSDEGGRAGAGRVINDGSRSGPGS
jgi:hypothetical protein